MTQPSPAGAERAPTPTHRVLPRSLRFANRGARLAFGAAALVAFVAGVSEGTLAAQAATAPAAPGARAGQPAAAAATVVLVMRHAERDPGADPPLNAAGVARAERFAEAAREAQVAAVYVTQFRRTRETAEPMARAAGAAVVERPVAGDVAAYAAALAREVRERHAGRTVAVVGHSNTVPALVAALTGRPAPALGDADYGDVFVVVLPPAGPAAAPGAARVLRLRAGA